VRLPGIVDPLRNRDFRLLWAGQTVSIVGDYIAGIAFPFQILALGGGAFEFGISWTLNSGSFLVFLLIGGAMVDRVPRRLIILASDLIRGLGVGIIFVLATNGALRIEHVYAMSVVFGTTAAFFDPAMGAIIPELVPADVLQAGNALRGLSRQIALLGGPVLGGLLVAAGGPALAYGVDAMTFLVSFIALLTVRPPRREAPPPAPLLRQVREGLAFTFSIPWLWVSIFGWALVNAGASGPLIVALPLLVTEVLRGDARLYGTILAALGVGQVIGTVVFGQFHVRRLGAGVYLLGVLAGAAIILIGVFPLAAVVLVGVGVKGFADVGVGVLWQTAVQKHVPRKLLGRVTSIDFFGGTLIAPVAPLIFALIVGALGSPAAFVVGGAVAASFCAFGLLLPSIRDLE
jgi:MFS family permease